MVSTVNMLNYLYHMGYILNHKISVRFKIDSKVRRRSQNR